MENHVTTSFVSETGPSITVRVVPEMYALGKAAWLEPAEDGFLDDASGDERLGALPIASISSVEGGTPASVSRVASLGTGHIRSPLRDSMHDPTGDHHYRADR